MLSLASASDSAFFGSQISLGVMKYSPVDCDDSHTTLNAGTGIDLYVLNGVLFPVWIMCLHQAEKTRKMARQWPLCSDSRFSAGTRRPSHSPALGEAFVLRFGRQRSAEGWRVKSQSCRGS